MLIRVLARDDAAWQRLTQLYTPMVYRWARKAGLQPDDAEDVVQNVFLTVAADIGRFRRSRPGDSFRRWLWTISRHKTLDFFRGKAHRELAVGGTTANLRIEQHAVAETEPTDENDEMCRLRHRALALLREHFENPTWQAFLRVVIHGDHPADVARDLGISVATVYRAKVRVSARLRAELEGL